MTRNGIVNVAEVVTYDVIKDRLIGGGVMSEGIPCHLVSAFVAGFCATVVASPVDVVKTRYMNSMPSQYQNAIHCAMVLWRELGFGGFYKGYVIYIVSFNSYLLKLHVTHQMYNHVQKLLFFIFQIFTCIIEDWDMECFNVSEL